MPDEAALLPDLAEAWGTRLSLAVGPDRELLVAQGAHFYAFERDAAGARLQTPNGVRISEHDAVVLAPGRRLALGGGTGRYWANTFSGSPTWRSEPSAQLETWGLDPSARPRWISVATNSNGDSLVEASVGLVEDLVSGAQGVPNRRISFLVRADGTVTDAALYPATNNLRDGDTLVREPGRFDSSPYALMSLGRGLFAARVVLNPTINTGASRPFVNEVVLQNYASIRTGGAPPDYVPWHVLLRSPIPGIAGAGGTCQSLAAAAGENQFLILCGNTLNADGVQMRLASVSDSGIAQWSSDWSTLPDVDNAKHLSAVWNAEEHAFTVAVGMNFYDYPESLAGAVLLRVTTNAEVSPIRTLLLANVSLVDWSGEMWGAGVDRNGVIQVFRVEQESMFAVGTPLSFQEVGDAVLHRGSAVALWSDAAHQAMLTQFDFSERFDMRSQVIFPRSTINASPTSPSRFMVDRDDLFVASRVREQGFLARVDPASLTVTRQGRITGSIFNSVEFEVAGAVNSLILGIDRARLHVFDRDFQPVAQTSLPRAEVYFVRQCRDSRCVLETRYPIYPTMIASVDAGSLAVREWRADDFQSFPHCSIDVPGFDSRVRIRETGSCADASERPLPNPEHVYECVLDPERPGETCARLLAAASTASHTLVVEPREYLSAPSRVALRLLRNDTGVLLATRWLPAASTFGDATDLARRTTKLLHVRGGLFLLVYSRISETSRTARSYARVVYFPEADQPLS